MVRQLKQTSQFRQSAEQLAARYPALLAEAERVAASVEQGVHGRRRSGPGESFWQYRTYQASDTARQIDWRRSARGDEHYVRENEWEAANHIYLWADGSPGMGWHSQVDLPLKSERAKIILLALSILLSRGGERCAVLGEMPRALAGRHGLEQITQHLVEGKGSEGALSKPIPRHARIIIASDFLQGIEFWKDQLAALAARPVRGVLIHIIDPAEREFPFSGRMELSLPGVSSGNGEAMRFPFLLGRAERARTAYQAKFQAHCDTLKDMARRLGWPLIQHHTDAQAALALTAIFAAIENGYESGVDV